MSSFIKANKQRVSQIKNLLEGVLRREISDHNDGMWVTEVDVFVSSPAVRHATLRISCTVDVFATRHEVFVEEYGSRVIFGVDVSDLKVRVSNNDTLLDCLYRYVYDGHISSEARNQLDKELGRSYLTYYEKTSLCSTSLYKDIMEYMQEDAVSYSFEVRDDEYPYIPNRRLLPLLVFDIESGKGWYSVSSHATPSRRRRREISFFETDFRKCCVRAVRRYPSDLLIMRASGKSYDLPG